MKKKAERKKMRSKEEKKNVQKLGGHINQVYIPDKIDII